VASVANGEWDTTARARLDELEAIHTRAHGRSAAVDGGQTSSTYCRDLHDEAVDVYVAAANPRQEVVLRKLVTQGRELDKKNPRPGALGSDFGRLGIELVPKLKAVSKAVTDAVLGLEVLVDFRNAVAHGNESALTAAVATGQIKATLASYRAHRRALNALVGTIGPSGVDRARQRASRSATVVRGR